MFGPWRCIHFSKLFTHAFSVQNVSIQGPIQQKLVNLKQVETISFQQFMLFFLRYYCPNLTISKTISKQKWFTNDFIELVPGTIFVRTMMARDSITRWWCSSSPNRRGIPNLSFLLTLLSALHRVSLVIVVDVTQTTHVIQIQLSPDIQHLKSIFILS